MSMSAVRRSKPVLVAAILGLLTVPTTSTGATTTTEPYPTTTTGS
jgi:hypothetical protein